MRRLPFDPEHRTVHLTRSTYSLRAFKLGIAHINRLA